MQVWTMASGKTAAIASGKPFRPSTTAISTSSVDSSGRRNTAYVSCSEELVQSLGRGSPAQGLSRPAVEGDRHGRKVVRAVHAEVSDGVDAPRRHRRAKVVVLTAT